MASITLTEESFKEKPSISVQNVLWRKPDIERRVVSTYWTSLLILQMYTEDTVEFV